MTGDQLVGFGILIVLLAIVAWMLCISIREGLKKAARLPERPVEWHASLLSAGETQPTAPTSVIPIVQPARWEREVRALLEQLEAEEEQADADDLDRRAW